MDEATTTRAVGNCQLLVFEHDSSALRELKVFLRLTEALHIPLTRCPGRLINRSEFEHLIRSLSTPQGKAVRKVLLLCGAYLEEQVSAATHFLLAAGFDVLLVRDLMLTENPALAYLHDMRLLHAGAFSTTSKQLVYEWSVLEPQGMQRELLLKFLDETPSSGAPR